MGDLVRDASQEEAPRAGSLAPDQDQVRVVLLRRLANNADLVLVGNKGMTGARRFLLGSVPNKISPPRALRRVDRQDDLARRTHAPPAGRAHLPGGGRCACPVPGQQQGEGLLLRRSQPGCSPWPEMRRDSRNTASSPGGRLPGRAALGVCDEARLLQHAGDRRRRHDLQSVGRPELLCAATRRNARVEVPNRRDHRHSGAIGPTRRRCAARP